MSKLRWSGLLAVTLAASMLLLPFAQAEAARPGVRDQHDQGKGNDRRYAVPDRAYRPPRVGHVYHTLPRDYPRIRVGPDRYRYYGGVFYGPWEHDSYIVVHAPIGARVHHLPASYISFYIGPRRYFYGNLTYYLWDAPTREYVVVAEPTGARRAVVSASESGSGDIFVYPSRGQSNEQRDRDRYECYVWASQQSGYDPGDDNPAVGNAPDYRRALSACLEGRGYTVR